MQKKYGKFYADWYDAQGKRHRKAFTTRKAAAAHQKLRQDKTKKDRTTHRRLKPSPTRGARPATNRQSAR